MLEKKDILFGTEARKKILRGMDIVADAVGSTLGPLGRNVAVDEYRNMDIPPKVYHDGVSVAKQINLKDKFEDMGARLLKDAALKTNEKAGDGTTTSTILAQAIVREALSSVESGNNPMVVKKEIEQATEEALKELKKLAKKISKPEEVEQVATVSSANPEVGKLVAEAIQKVGKDGVITVEEGQSLETTTEYKQGMEVGRGFLSPYFKTTADEAIIEDAYILLTDKKINYHYDIIPFLEKFTKETQSKNLVIFAGEVVEEALSTLVVNKLRGSINVVAVQAPAFGEMRVDELEDIAVITGGKLILQDEGTSLDSIDISELGQAKKVIVDHEKTVIVDGAGSKEAVASRASQLRQQIANAGTPFDKDTKEKRLAKLSGSVAVITVGAATEVELKEKKERVIDAVNATKAAVEEGIVAGGEITLLKLAQSPTKAFSTVGGKIVKQALKAPFKRLVENAGIDYAEVWGKLSGQEYPIGIDVTTGEVKNLIEAGVIDPVKVTRYALMNAVSVATMVLTTDTIVTFAEDEKDE